MSETEKEKHQHDFIEVNQQPKPEEKQARKQVRQILAKMGPSPPSGSEMSSLTLRPIPPTQEEITHTGHVLTQYSHKSK